MMRPQALKHKADIRGRLSGKITCRGAGGTGVARLRASACRVAGATAADDSGNGQRPIHGRPYKRRPVKRQCANNARAATWQNDPSLHVSGPAPDYRVLLASDRDWCSSRNFLGRSRRRLNGCLLCRQRYTSAVIANDHGRRHGCLAAEIAGQDLLNSGGAKHEGRQNDELLHGSSLSNRGRGKATPICGGRKEPKLVPSAFERLGVRPHVLRLPCHSQSVIRRVAPNGRGPH